MCAKLGRISLIKAERDENTCRKDFAPSEAVALGEKLEVFERKKAADRKKSTQAKVGTGKVGKAKLATP